MGEQARAAREFADRYWEQLLELDPLLATEVGDERFDDRLPDPTDEGVERERRVHEAALEELGRLEEDGLPEDLRTALAVGRAIAEQALDRIRFRMDRLHAVSHLWGPAGLLGDLASVQRADTPERLERYLRRLSALPGYLEAVGRVALDGARLGQTAPALVVDRAIAQVERLLATPPEASPGVQPVPETDARGRQRVVEVLREAVWPAYEGYLEVLRDYRPHARETVGLSALPDGEAMYAALVRAYTTLPLAPEEVHRLGQEDLAGIQEERRALARALGGEDPDRVMAEHRASGRDTARTREELLERARRQVRRSWEAAPRFFGRLPRANCEVRPVEAFREEDMPGAYYVPPTHDGSRPGVYYVNTSHLDARPLHQLAATTYHEANPGHHFQLSIEVEFSDRPPLRRFGGFLSGTAFIEGWGLYSERLADEMGLFEDDCERMGMLEAQAWRAARLVVDTGLHAFGWDRERAVATLEGAGVPRKDAEVEVDRYIAAPGQALAYKVGQLHILKLRRAAEERAGPSFSLRAFHDRLLALGSLPLPVLERELGLTGAG
ncbi:MAG TPA: DUF885 domain-containing protein [Actinomycetota bacterium]|nr:DUF885 domain-containing protein [Actinomycetota bacterium]